MTAFSAEYEDRYVLDWPSRAPEVFLADGARPGPERLVEVALPDGSARLVSVAAFPDPPRHAVSGLFPRPALDTSWLWSGARHILSTSAIPAGLAR
jgi:hypothetical protein